MFTAAQIAQALGHTPRGVRKALAQVPTDGLAMVQGKATNAWKVATLPGKMRDDLAALAAQRGFDSAERLLAHAPVRWQPTIGGKPVCMAELAPHCMEDASKLQQALSGVLADVVSGQRPREEIEAMGLRDYTAIFGHVITGAHWWRLVDRTLQRNAGTGDFSRPEIYLADKLARKETRPAGYSAAVTELHNLRDKLLAVKNPPRPTADEQAMIWDAAFVEAEALIEGGTTEHRARQTVFDALAKAGVYLGKTRRALKRNFNRKLTLWIDRGRKLSAIKDKRTKNSGRFRATELPEEDKNTILARARECGGRLAQGWRNARDNGELSFETTQRFITNPSRKSHVPGSVRLATANDVRLLADMHHGPRRAKLNGAFISRDHSDTAAGDWYQGDDVTLNHYYYEETPEGIKDMRGQFLLFCDVRTNYIPGFSLHSEKNYTARVIRETILRIHDSYGLPRQGFYFERGIWKSARVITGQAQRDEIPLEETEMGLSEFVRFKHAQLPRAKVIERIIGLLQNEMECLPAYAGRNEAHDKYERLQKKLLEARAGKIPYDSFLLSKAQWTELLVKACEKHNDTPQGGKLGGLSPCEAWEKYFSSPLIRLENSQRFLLANHRKPMKVGRNGIRLTFKGQSVYYRNHATGPLEGRQVLVWYTTDEETPQSITITDLDKGNPVEVEREIKPPSMTATGEELGLAYAQVEAHNAYAKTLYRTIKPKFMAHMMLRMFRPVVADADTVTLGQEIAQQREKVGAEHKSKAIAFRRLRAKLGPRGLTPALTAGDARDRLKGLEQISEARKLAATQNESGDVSELLSEPFHSAAGVLHKIATPARGTTSTNPGKAPR